MNEKIEKMIKAFTLRTVESAISGFIIEQNDEITNEVRKYLDALTTEEVIEIQKFLNKLLNLCYNGNLFEMTATEEEIASIKSLTEQEKFLLKETIIYFSGRLSVKTDLDTLKKAYKLDNNKYIKLNIAFASLQTFDEEIEIDFVKKLVPDSEYDIMLRSWTMAFFKKAPNPYEYKDDQNDDWSVAKLPRIKRLSINDEKNPKYIKAMAFRLLDLAVINLFLENRKNDCLTEEERKIITNTYIDYELYSEFKKAMLNQFKQKILERR